MPLYNDLGFYRTPPNSSYGLPSFLQSSYGRAISGCYVPPPPRYSNLSRGYTPMLMPINENPYKHKYTKTYKPTYIPPRPIQINTADIDVSASKFDKNRHLRARSTSPEPTPAPETPEASVSKESDLSDAKDFMPRIDQNDPPQFRTTIKRCRPIVRLSTVRAKSISRSKSRSLEKSNSMEKRKSIEKRSSVEKSDSFKSASGSRSNSAKERDPSNKPSKSNSSSSIESSDSKKSTTATSWRDKLEDVLVVKTPKVVRKTPGELILEKHIIRDNRKDVIEKVPQIPKTIVQIPESVTEQEITYLEPLIQRKIRRQSIKQCPSFKDICKEISSDIKANGDLNAGDLRRRASLIHEQEQQILAQFSCTRRLSSDVVNVDKSIMEVDEDDDQQKSEQKDPAKETKEEKDVLEGKTGDNIIVIKKKTKKKGGKLKHKITVTVEVNNLTTENPDSPGASFKKSPRWEAVVEEIEDNNTIQEIVTLPTKKSEGNKHLERRISKSESGVDFWKLLGRKESIYTKAPVLKLKEDLDTTSTEQNREEDSVPTVEPIADPVGSVPQAAVPLESLSETNKADLSSESAVKPVKKIVKKKKKTAGVTQSTESKTIKEDDENTAEVAATTTTVTPTTATMAIKTTTKTAIEKENTIIHSTNSTKNNDKSNEDTLYTKSLMQTSELKIDNRPTAKAPETKQKQTYGRDEGGDEKSGNVDAFDDVNGNVVIKKTASISQQRDADRNDASDVKENLKQEVNKNEKVNKNTCKIKHDKLATNTAGATTTAAAATVLTQVEGKINEIKINKDNSSDLQPQSIKTDANLNSNENANNNNNNNNKKNGNVAINRKIEHLAKTTTTTTAKTSEQNDDTFETVGTVLTKYPTINNLNSNLSSSCDDSVVDQTFIKPSSIDDDAEADFENCISGEESIDLLSSSSSVISKRGGAGDSDNSFSYSDGGSDVDEMGLKRRHKKKKDKFDPKKVVKLDHSRKCYVVNEEPKYPLIATPRPLQKKYKFYSDSETDDESYSDNDSSDEYYDEDVIKGDVIRMSRCSNDSGFEGSGTVITNPKKILGK